MRLRHVVPFMLLFAWQAAPSPDPGDRSSRFRLWFGGGVTAFDFRAYGCGCNSCGIEDAQDTVHTLGAQADAWVSPTVRVTAGAGIASESIHPGGSGPTATLFATGLLAWEGRNVGLGGGWAAARAQVGHAGPSAYARLGPLDGWHFRADLRAPTATPGVTGWARAGLGYNLGGRGRTSLFAGLSAVKAGTDAIWRSDAVPQPPVPVTDKLGVFADVTFGMGRRLAFLARGHLAKRAGGVGLGIRVLTR